MNFWQRLKHLVWPAKPEERHASKINHKNSPYAELVYIDKKLVVKKYNPEFVEKLRTELGDLTDGKTDEQIVNLYVDRENIEREDPKLEVLHLGMNDDGTVKMKLDWNRSFINHLRENGIMGETEEEAIENYLQLLHRHAASSTLDPSPEDIDGAFGNLDVELESELEAARKQLKDKKPKRRRVNRYGPSLPDSPESI